MWVFLLVKISILFFMLNFVNLKCGFCKILKKLVALIKKKGNDKKFKNKNQMNYFIVYIMIIFKKICILRKHMCLVDYANAMHDIFISEKNGTCMKR